MVVKEDANVIINGIFKLCADMGLSPIETLGILVIAQVELVNNIETNIVLPVV